MIIPPPPRTQREVVVGLTALTPLPLSPSRDVSGVTTLQAAFAFASSFNANIGGWWVIITPPHRTQREVMVGLTALTPLPLSPSRDVSGVTTLAYAFQGASSFNANIGGW